MSESAPGDVTLLLNRVQRGDKQAESNLITAVYAELRRMAARQMRRERPGHTLQTTALVHEAYLKLIDQKGANWQNRAHFFAVAARVMRRILVDYARNVWPRSVAAASHACRSTRHWSSARKNQVSW